MVETESAAATLAMEMRVCVVVDTGMAAVAQFVTDTSTPVVDNMDDMVLAEEREGTEDTRLVEREDALLQFAKRQWPFRSRQSLDHNEPIGGGFYAMPCEETLEIFRFHVQRCLIFELCSAKIHKIIQKYIDISQKNVQKSL